MHNTSKQKLSTPDEVSNYIQRTKKAKTILMQHTNKEQNQHFQITPHYYIHPMDQIFRQGKLCMKSCHGILPPRSMQCLPLL